MGAVTSRSNRRHFRFSAGLFLKLRAHHFHRHEHQEPSQHGRHQTRQIPKHPTCIAHVVRNWHAASLPVHKASVRGPLYKTRTRPVLMQIPTFRLSSCVLLGYSHVRSPRAAYSERSRRRTQHRLQVDYPKQAMSRHDQARFTVSAKRAQRGALPPPARTSQREGQYAARFWIGHCCNRMQTVPSVPLATARSSFPSPLKSAAVIADGPFPTA